jgi:DNA-binding LytR/AlgR family response regulator
MDKKVIKVCLKDILYIESMKYYIKVKTPNQEVISHQKISYMEENLPKNQFMRVHRSFIVSVPNIQAYSASNVEIGGHDIPIGRNYKDIVIPQLNQNLF